ncbi:MAG: Lrp/AsnC family transcriptional regulator [Theionarchaea archaeon]|jgi:Lrp/AsnC family transcriptional regulator for asnA, asnC and gidA|nr:Lrp/AsnC family transcriptional regulator [Theionarchaea archaeon]
MDQLDREILRELLQDSRKPTSEISRELNKPNSTIDFRIKKMMEKNIIKGFTVITDQSALSKTFAQIIVDVEKPFFKDRYREVIEDVAHRLAEHTEICVVAAIREGKLLCIVACADALELNEFINEKIKMTPYVRSCETEVFLDVYKNNVWVEDL